MTGAKRVLTTVKVVALVMIVVSVSVVAYTSVGSISLSGYSWNPYSSASYNTTEFSPHENYSLYVTADNCKIEVIPSSTNYLRANLEVTNTFFQKAFANVEVTERSNSFTFEIITPKGFGTDATAYVYVPLLMPVDIISITTENGNINVDSPEFTANMVMETTNGNVNLAGGHLGNVTMQITNGNIYVTSASFTRVIANTLNGNAEAHFAGHISTGTLSFTATNGNLNFYVNSTSNLTISSSTVNGAVSVSGLTYTANQFTIRQFIGTVNSGGANINLATVNGNVGLKGT